MKGSKKVLYLLPVFVFLVVSAPTVFAQNRERVVRTVSSRPTNLPPAVPDKPITAAPSGPSQSSPSRPTLTNNITVAPPEKPLVTKTGSTSSLNAAKAASSSRRLYSSSISESIMSGIEKRLGIPYLYGSNGPNRYDCSGFVWAVFKDAGIDFERSSARTLWNASIPVTGDERFKFGTLVFMNKLGHMGIVADETGFYHASSSKGITYSKFEGYWKNRIVGYRRLPLPEKTSAAPITVVLDQNSAEDPK